MFRYLRLLGIQLRTSALLSLQYRYDFVVDGALSVFWAAAALIPLFVVFEAGERASVAGWTLPESLVVVGWFLLLGAVLDGAINPSLTSVVDHIRKGTLDFVLLKPADAQFLVSTSRFMPWKAMNAVSALAVFVYAFTQLGRWPTPTGVLSALLLTVSAVLLLYSLWIITVSAAFYVVRVDNLTYLFQSIFDAARYPVSLFPRLVQLLFTFVVPLALMTTYPAEALLGRLSPWGLVLPLVGSAAFALLARAVWLRSIGKYTSAGG